MSTIDSFPGGTRVTFRYPKSIADDRIYEVKCHFTDDSMLGISLESEDRITGACYPSEVQQA